MCTRFVGSTEHGDAADHSPEMRAELVLSRTIALTLEPP
jgi:hypothetical protein